MHPVNSISKGYFGQVESWDNLASSLTERFPKDAEFMLEAKEDVLAFRHFRQLH